MNYSWKRWRVALMGALTALVVVVGVASPAFAAVPGESGAWNEEYVGTQPLSTRGTVSEARNGAGDLLQVWRGETNNNVWLSFENQTPIQLRNPDGTYPMTNFSPVVVPYGSTGFMVLHTGTDGNIYYTRVEPSGSSITWTGYWIAVPGQSTNAAVSATQMGPGSTSVYMVYHSSNDDRVWGTYFNGGSWGNTENIGGGLSPTAPSVAWNDNSRTLWVVARGEDNQVWMTGGGSYAWRGWSPQGGYTYTQPAVAANIQTSHMLVSYVNENTFRPNYRAYDENGNSMGSWSQDITGWQTVNTVALSIVGAVIYALITGLNGNVYYKQAYNG
jgi:hypothetical protein